MAVICLIGRLSSKYNQGIMVMPGTLSVFCQRNDVMETYQIKCATCGPSYCRVEAVKFQELQK